MGEYVQLPTSPPSGFKESFDASHPAPQTSLRRTSGLPRLPARYYSGPSARIIVCFVLLCGSFLLYTLKDLHSIRWVPSLKSHDQPYLLVGPRRYSRRAVGHCGLDDLLSDLHDTRVPLNSPSTIPTNFSRPETDELPPFEFSFGMDKCGDRALHIFTPDEACDLLESYGGMHMWGDSHVRMVYYSILMLLQNSTDGAGYNPPDADCRKENRFRDRYKNNEVAPCLGTYYQDTRAENAPKFCSGKTFIRFDEIYTPNPEYLKGIHRLWQDKLPTDVRSRSPILYQGAGVHFWCDAKQTHDYLDPVIELQQHSFPRGVSIWAGVHATGPNMPEQWREMQGFKAIEKYDLAVEEILRNSKIGEPWEGATFTIPSYNATFGASSFDGQHYGYQVNMEKAQVLLNVLDRTYWDIVDAGGLVSHKERDIYAVI
ncbi:hypothetical protein T439DRAFT_174059 [Meredithblackwellia eburnea MCA 4105]